MQATLFKVETRNLDYLWLRAAQRECIEYGEHGLEIETAADGRPACFNCGGSL